MARRVTWTPRADEDFDETNRYLFRTSPQNRLAFIREVRESAASLAEMAERGRIVPELQSPDTRELLVGSYRLVYEISDDEVYILGLIHGARDLLALWRREGRGL